MIAILFVTPTYANQIRFHLRSKKHGKPLAILNRSSLLPALHCAPLAIWSSVFHATLASARGPSASKRFWCRWCCSIYKCRHRALLRLPLINLISTKVLIPSSKVQLSFLIFLDLLLNPLWIRFQPSVGLHPVLLKLHFSLVVALVTSSSSASLRFRIIRSTCSTSWGSSRVATAGARAPSCPSWPWSQCRSRSFTKSRWPSTQAAMKGLVSQVLWMLAFAVSNSWAMCRVPSRQAWYRGGEPARVRRFTSAAASISTRTASQWPAGAQSDTSGFLSDAQQLWAQRCTKCHGIPWCSMIIYGYLWCKVSLTTVATKCSSRPRWVATSNGV